MPNVPKRDSPLGLEQHVPRQLSYGYHVGRFLQLDGLLIYESAAVVHDHVRVKRAILALPLDGRSAESAVPLVAVSG